jgi:hypothetical protein
VNATSQGARAVMLSTPRCMRTISAATSGDVQGALQKERCRLRFESLRSLRAEAPMIQLMNLTFACSAPESADNGPNDPRGSSSLEAGDTEPAGGGDGGDEGDTGKFEPGVVTDVRITLPSTSFSTMIEEWFPVEFALVNDFDVPQDHWATLLKVTLMCDGNKEYIGGLDGIAGMMAISIGGGVNPRETTVMLVTACDSANLKTSLVPYNDAPPINAYSEPFVVR